MGQLLKSLRSAGRRAVFIAVAFCLSITQLILFGPQAARAIDSALTYMDHATSFQVAGYPSSIIYTNVDDGLLAAVGTDGQVYTPSGVVAGLNNVAKAFVGQDIGYAIKTDGTVWS